MSHGSASARRTQPRPAQQGGFAGLPTWSGSAIILACLITGLLISLYLGRLGLTYQLIFILGALTVTLLVEARGLFLTVAAIPLLFGLTTPVASWLISQQGINSGSGFSTTKILTAIYPLAQFFPTLIMVTIVSAFIAVVRIMLLRRNEQNTQVVGERARRAQRAADRANTTTATKARAQTSRTRTRRAPAPAEEDNQQVTVDELIRRSQQRRQHTAQVQADRGVRYTPRPGPRVTPEPEPKAQQAPLTREFPTQPPVDPRERRQAPPPRRRLTLDDDLYS
ncbi:DUF6542 domain-containing protein [Corynebacterium pacaense]|uniref:DUF6542 domain-containing protein n=1 Tax=Corynebacterium pacaense TaxID=1816684 RepID=UPI001FEA8BE7|nr:DUF6542 domain-containing protein [Corynebacterium pacaense]